MIIGCRQRRRQRRDPRAGVYGALNELVSCLDRVQLSQTHTLQEQLHIKQKAFNKLTCRYNSSTWLQPS